MKPLILLKTNNGNRVRDIRHTVETLGHSLEVIEERRWVQGGNRNRIPAVIMVENHDRLEQFSGWVLELKDNFPLARFIALVPETEMPRAMESLKAQVDDFIPTPLNTIALEMALKRMIELVELNWKIAALEKKREPGPPHRSAVAIQVETERFVAIRQVLDKVSSIIGQISRNAQG